MAKQRVWSREESVLAMDLYCRIPFGQCTYRNEHVQALARVLGRTPSAVARKLGNLARFDPALAARGVVGLRHGSKMDEVVWNSAHGDWEAFLVEAEKLRNESGHSPPKVPGLAEELFRRETQRTATSLQRMGQGFFRSMILSSYRSRCAVCDLDEPRLLIASHIKSWSADRQNRLNPRNGICLCAIHDAAFDQRMLVLDQGLRWQAKLPLRGKLEQDPYNQYFGRYEGTPLIAPERWHPDPNFIAWHRGHSTKEA